MHWLQAATVMALYDAKSVRRDRFLVWALTYPLVIALLLRYALPFITERLAQYVDLEPYWPLAVGYVVLVATPMLMGLVIGFMLIEERDEGTLNALLVTPMSLRNYLRYRAWAPALASVLSVFLCFLIAGLVAMPWYHMLFLALAASPLGPIVAVALGAFAENKVQGLGVLKMAGTVAILPVAMHFLPQPWQYLAGVFVPHYWVCAAYWAFAAGESAGYALAAAGFVVYAAVLAALLRRYAKQAYAGA